MTTNLLPVWISVTYAESPCQCHVSLRISANNDPSLSISITHGDHGFYGITGNGNVEDLQAQDSDTLLIVARNAHNEIVACGLYEISFESIRSLGSALVSRVSSNIELDQCAQRLIDSAATRALNEACGASTGDLVVALEVVR